MYLLHTNYLSTYSTSKEDILGKWGQVRLVILVGPHLTISFKGLMVKTTILWDSSKWTSWMLETCGRMTQGWQKIFIIVSLLQSNFCSLLSCYHAYSRHCGRNFNLKNTRGNPSPRCSLMDHRGTGVCREWLNSARRPGTIKSRLLLCNRPFPSHNVTSGKTWRSRTVCVCVCVCARLRVKALIAGNFKV